MIVTVAGTPQSSGVTANDFSTAQTYVVSAADTTTKSFVVTVVIASNTAKDLTTFAFLSSHNSGLVTDVTATINGTAITATVPFGTNVSALVATFTTSGASVAVGVTPQISGVTSNDFTTPSTYVVMAADTTTKPFIVTVLTASNTAKDLSTFAFRSSDNPGLSADVSATFNGAAITATVPFGTDVSALVASFSTSGASVSVGGVPQTSGITANDFTVAKSYVVTASDASTKPYIVTVAIASNTAKDITTFSFLTIHNPGLAADVTATINGTAITATVPFGTNVSALIASFATTGATVTISGTAQTSGGTANNFATATTYLVTASDASTRSYTVTLGIAPSGAKDLSAFAFRSSVNSGLGADVIASISGTTITATVPYGTDVTALIATFSTTGASVAIAGAPQTSGVTPNSFTSATTYTVTANDSSTKSYTATVTSAPNTAKDIGAFSFLSIHNPGLAADVIASVSGATITATVPFGTDVTALVATFSTTGTSVAIGGAAQTSGVTPNSFTTPISYVVSAADSSTKPYTVTVTSAPSGAKDLTSFVFLSSLNPGLAADVSASISGTTITATVPFGTDVTALIASFGTSGSIVDVGVVAQTSGVTANNFTSLVTYLVRAADTTSKAYTVTVTAAPSGAKDLTTFRFLSSVNSGLNADVIASISGTTITATVPFGTDLSALVATFGTTGTTVAVAGTPQISGVSANDFRSTVSYDVTASNLSVKSYTVTVTAAQSGAKDLTTFKFLSAANSGLAADVVAGISGTTITATVPFGTDLSALVASYGTTGASVAIAGSAQTSGVTANSFTSAVTYVVTASDSSVKSYSVTVTVALNSAKDIGTFAFLSSANSGLAADVVAGISGTTITATVPFGTDLSALVGTYGTTGASVAVAGTPQVSGVTANNFTSSATYDVTASDLSTKSYTVTVTVALNSAKDIVTFAFLSSVNSGLAADVTASISGSSIAATVPFGTDVSALIPTFGTTGASVTVAGTAQVSGVTANDFTGVPTYLVTAADLSTKPYTVTVTAALNSAKAIGSFAFLSSGNSGLATDVTASITGTSITATVPSGTDVSALIPTFTTSGASVSVGSTTQVSGVTANDFTSPVTYVVTAADSSFQQYTVTVTAAASHAGTYYVNALFTQATSTVIGIASSGTDIYFLVQTNIGLYEVEKVDTAGTVTIMATTSTAAWKDIIVVGNYLFILQSITTSSTTYSAVRYSLPSFSTPTTLALPLTPKKFASGSGSIVYINGTTTAKGVIYFDSNTFSSYSTARTAIAYSGLAYRGGSTGTTSYGYLYGTRGTTGAGSIDEIDVSFLNPTVPPPTTTSPCPTEIVTPNLISWVTETASFVISDKNVDGSLGATTNGQIYTYAPTFNATTGALSSIGSGTLLIRGNSNSGAGYTETQFTTMLPSNTLSTDSSAYLYQAAVVGYNVTATGYINLFVGNGTVSGTGYLIKFYDSVTGSSIGGL
jgi:hypothetical protein